MTALVIPHTPYRFHTMDIEKMASPKNNDPENAITVTIIDLSGIKKTHDGAQSFLKHSWDIGTYKTERSPKPLATLQAEFQNVDGIKELRTEAAGLARQAIEFIKCQLQPS